MQFKKKKPIKLRVHKYKYEIQAHNLLKTFVWWIFHSTLGPKPKNVSKNILILRICGLHVHIIWHKYYLWATHAISPFTSKASSLMLIGIHNKNVMNTCCTY